MTVPDEEVYPCVYREHTISGRWMCVIIGLSLCVQGTLNRNLDPDKRNRFIPVCTGNIERWSTFCKRPPVYPCVYREH